MYHEQKPDYDWVPLVLLIIMMVILILQSIFFMSALTSMAGHGGWR